MEAEEASPKLALPSEVSGAEGIRGPMGTPGNFDEVPAARVIALNGIAASEVVNHFMVAVTEMQFDDADAVIAALREGLRWDRYDGRLCA